MASFLRGREVRERVRSVVLARGLIESDRSIFLELEMTEALSLSVHNETSTPLPVVPVEGHALVLRTANTSTRVVNVLAIGSDTQVLPRAVQSSDS